VIVQEGEVALVEDAEPVLPLDFLQRVFAAEAGIIDAKDVPSLHPRRRAAALLHPLANLVVIGRCAC
jgi:hypothetical protein